MNTSRCYTSLVGRYLRSLGMILATGVSSVLLLGTSFAESEMRTFRDQDGREINARILKANASTVTLAMENGKEYTLPHSKFSAEDQKFIGEWAAKNPAPVDYRLEFTYNKKRLGKTQNKQGSIDVTKEEWTYEVNVRNQSQEAAEGIDFQYRVYYSDSQQGTGASRDKFIKYSAGTEKIEALARTATAQFATTPVMLIETDLDGDFYYSDGSKGTKRDQLEGIWIKAFQNGRKISEYKSNDPEVKKASWPDDESNVASSKESQKD